MPSASIDNVQSRNNVAITLTVAGQRVGRVQQFRSSQANNVQTIAELGRDYMVEMQKGLTVFTFTLSKFYVRNDMVQTLRDGTPFSLIINDNSAPAEVIDAFDQCMFTSLDTSYSAGAVTVGMDASAVTIGKGKLGL